jgi:thioredoxin 1
MADAIEVFSGADFEREVLGSAQPVLVDFWAAWCQPCLAMAPDLEAVAQSFKGRLRVGKLNVEQHQELAARFNVTALPTLLVFKGGTVADQRVGRLTRDALTKLVEPYV